MKNSSKAVVVYVKYSPPPFKTKQVADQPFRRDSHASIKSVVASGGCAESKQTIQYTGDKLLGITIMHKSNLVPIFSQQEAVEVSHMRR